MKKTKSKTSFSANISNYHQQLSAIALFRHPAFKKTINKVNGVNIVNMSPSLTFATDGHEHIIVPEALPDIKFRQALLVNV